MDHNDVSPRAAGLLVGLALGDGWAQATEIALCIADAASTGLALDDPRSVDLIQRNLRDRRATAPGGASGQTLSDDTLLAACAVVAVAHHGDTQDERDTAVRAVLAVLGGPSALTPDHLLWTQTVAAIINAESFDVVRRLREEFAMRSLYAVADAVEAASAGPDVGVRHVGDAAPSRQADAMRITPAATGAVVGALVGLDALPAGPVAALSGWPDADAAALVEMARDVAAKRERGLPGVALPVRASSAPSDDNMFDRPEGSGRWRVVRIALTALGAEGAR